MRLVDADADAFFRDTPPALDSVSAGLSRHGETEPDHAQAVYWLQLAAEAGDAEALGLLGYHQLEGLGLPRDAAQARDRLERASAEGSLTAKFHLGRMLVAGWGGAPDAARGVALYTTAARLGHADATFNLACCLDAGWGCQPDRLAAKALFVRARALGSPLKAPGLRVRERELGAVRELVRRLEASGDLGRVIEERQHEITLMHELVRPAPAPRRLGPTQRRVLRVAALGALVVGAALVLAGYCSAAWRGSRTVAHDAGPTSIS